MLMGNWQSKLEQFRYLGILEASFPSNDNVTRRLEAELSLQTNLCWQKEGTTWKDELWHVCYLQETMKVYKFHDDD